LQVPDILKTLPDTPEEQPASDFPEQEIKIRDERHRYPQRNAPPMRHAISQGLLPSPSKSPSMPNFYKVNGSNDQASLSALNLNAQASATRERPLIQTQQSRPAMVHTRSQSNPVSPLVNVSEHSPTFSPTSLTPSTRMSKRAHLIHEICTTERSYAQDLALVRDVYLHKLGPSSIQSASSALLTRGSGWISPGEFSSSSRLSAHTVETSASGRTAYGSSPSNSSKQDLSASTDPATANSVTVRPDYTRTASANSTGPLTAGARPMSGLYSSSFESTQGVPAPRPRRRLTVSDALSPSDVRTVFMNLEQLASFVDELATAFERALGDASGAEPILKGGQEDVTTDRLGEVFLSVVSMLPPVL
jgi:hypothetical protein